MFRIFLIIITVAFTMNGYSADMKFSKMASGKPELIQSGPQKMWCPVCGMNLKMFYKTSHALKLTGDVNKQYCSIRCMLHDHKGLESIVREILVVDAKTEKLINALTAYYVIGSSAPGTMTMISKYAFADPKDAKEFQSKMGGQIADFTAAKASALESMKKDVAMTDMKRSKMMYPKGEKIFNSVCSKSIDPMKYNLINEMKADIKMNNLCGEIKEPELQAVALYLFDVVRKNSAKDEFINVPEDAKCPVCGMFVGKYPKWAAEITYSSNGAENSLYFDGVKDMLKFYFAPEKWGSFKNIKIKDILVTDYYSNKAVKAENAFFVTGSDVYGPMGKEFIPFKNKDEAEIFMKDHSGKKLIKFSDIDESAAYRLDE